MTLHDPQDHYFLAAQQARQDHINEIQNGPEARRWFEEQQKRTMFNKRERMQKAYDEGSSF